MLFCGLLAAGLWVVRFIAMLGVPMPPFLTPKWVRDRRMADREVKRRRRAERKARQAEYWQRSTRG
ncbi:hypothetical protein GCM10008096_15690 [Zhihengliuella salsuginis]|uniref:Uncharacterized protein n=1 Tax=Zhihengliuella salsuginis TaxID=578222 RepID=A0ABQ3GGZ2_9MICC|nr:hypothetical protein GCM10008096_15690 [Zhihengliuella salsuginis]